MTLQEAFDQVWQRFVVNKEGPSIDPSTGICLYRGPNDTKCALGGFIPDDKYKPSMEGKGPYYPKVKKAISINAHYPTLSDLQCCHDHAARTTHKRCGTIKEIFTHEEFTQRIQVKLTEFAKQYNLTMPT